MSPVSPDTTTTWENEITDQTTEIVEDYTLDLNDTDMNSEAGQNELEDISSTESSTMFTVLFEKDNSTTTTMITTTKTTTSSSTTSSFPSPTTTPRTSSTEESPKIYISEYEQLTIKADAIDQDASTPTSLFDILENFHVSDIYSSTTIEPYNIPITDSEKSGDSQDSKMSTEISIEVLQEQLFALLDELGKKYSHKNITNSIMDGIS